MPVNYTLPPDTRAVGTPDPANDVNALIDAAKASGAVFNVLNAAYSGGADPTGVADATNAFAAAITAVNSAGGGVLRVPAGTYKVNTAQLVVCTGLHIVGDGYNCTTINCTAGGSYLFNLDPPGYSTSTHVDDLLITGLNINATGMDIFWGANITRSRIVGNFLQQNSAGNAVMNVAQATGTNGATYIAECEFNNREITTGASRTIEAWHLDFSGTGLRANDNLWNGAGSKIWPPASGYWMKLIGDASGSQGSRKNVFRNLIFECASGTGGFIDFRNCGIVTLENVSSEDLGSNTVGAALINVGTQTTGGCSGITVRNYSRRSGSNISNSLPDLKFDSNATQVTIDSPQQQSGGTQLTIDLGSATNVTMQGAWPASYTLLNTGGLWTSITPSNSWAASTAGVNGLFARQVAGDMIEIFGDLTPPAASQNVVFGTLPSGWNVIHAEYIHMVLITGTVPTVGGDVRVVIQGSPATLTAANVPNAASQRVAFSGRVTTSL